MQAVLAVTFLVVLLSFWRAHHNKSSIFNAFDLVMENGRVSKIAVSFMGVFGVTTWVIIDLQVSGKLTEGFFATYGAMWVAPLVAKVVFNKSEMPTGTTLTSTTTVTEKLP